jgi:hypothetical protein
MADTSTDTGPAPGRTAHDYAQIARPFDHTFSDVRGGVTLEYATGEQVITRLNEDLGMGAWDFEIIEHGISVEADECWVLGKLTARILVDDPNLPGELICERVVKTQFGSQKVKRSRSSGNPLDIGFDLKGAATDCLKKCASLLGVGLYLWEKEAPWQPGGETSQPAGETSRATQNGRGRLAAVPSDPPAPADPGRLAQFEAAAAEARALGVNQPLLAADPSGWSADNLERNLQKVDQWIAQARGR